MKTPVYMWRFPSSSGSGAHETLKYDDGTLSCSCPGWCKRPIRSCKHTRAVELGDTNNMATAHGPVTGQTAAEPVAVTTTTAGTPKGKFSRKFV